jgi:2'-5' RNA ligase
LSTPKVDPPLRLFLGLWPDEATRDALLAQALRWQWPPSARRARAERLHLTLHFLGDVEGSRLAVLQQGLDLPWPGCTLELDRPEVWPGGIAVIEASRVPAELAALHSTLGERLARLGVPVEGRRYRPHVTLARKAFGARPPTPAEPLTWRAAGAYLLVRSLPGGRGYEPLQCFG